MTITRNINGEEVKIELTAQEMREAFETCERNYRKEDIRTIPECKRLSNKKIDKIVTVLERILDHNDYYYEVYWDSVSDAIDEVLCK